MNKKVIALFSTLLLTLALTTIYSNKSPQKTLEQLYQDWKSEHGLKRTYVDEEDGYRFKIFKSNV